MPVLGSALSSPLGAVSSHWLPTPFLLLTRSVGPHSPCSPQNPFTFPESLGLGPSHLIGGHAPVLAGFPSLFTGSVGFFRPCFIDTILLIHSIDHLFPFSCFHSINAEGPLCTCISGSTGGVILRCARCPIRQGPGGEQAEGGGEVSMASVGLVHS